MTELNNVRHEKFAQCIAVGMSQRKAYRTAFPSSEKWKDTTVDCRASELCKNSKVLGRIKELAEEASSKAVMTARERKEWLSALIRNKDEATRERLKAVDLLNKMEGDYIERVLLDGQVNNPMAGLTTEELKKLINDE